MSPVGAPRRRAAGAGRRRALALAAALLFAGCGGRGWPVGAAADSGRGLRAQAYVLRPSGKAAFAEYRVRVTRGPTFRGEHARTTEVWRSQGVQPVELRWSGADTLVITVDRGADKIHRWRARLANRLRVHVRTVVR